jgi:Zn-dependent peptidase ImmA (M78 family)
MRYDTDIEAEANYFAMCLLMPEDILRREIALIGPVSLVDDEQTAKLAKKFGVSITLLMYRLANLGLLNLKTRKGTR